MKMFKNIQYITVLLLSMLITVTSCTKYDDPPLIFEEEVPPAISKERKVLLVVVDGLSGIELNKKVPPFISSLLPYSKYTLEGFSDSDTGDAATWTTLMSGRSHEAHGIQGNSFEAEYDEDDPHGHNNPDATGGYTTVFQRILETGRLMKTAAYTSSQDLADHIFSLADIREVSSSDEATKSNALDLITGESKEYSFIVVNFGQVNKAGLEAGFSIDNPGYAQAIRTVDGYVEELVEAVKNRKTYPSEDWLIVITSSHGGLDNSYGGPTFPERKIPVIFYNDRFTKHEWEVPSLLSHFPRLTGSWSAPVRAVIPADKATAFNFGTSGDYTIQLKINLKARGASWPGFFGKKKTTLNNSGEPGWSFMFHDPASEPFWRPHIGHQTSGNVNQLSSIPVPENKWTTLTLKIYEEGGKRYAQGFTNGSKHVNLEITGRDLNNNEPLILGGMDGWISTTSTMDVGDIRIYKTALPDEVIQNTFCQNYIDESDPYYSDLIGYWPATEGIGGLLKDYIGEADFVFERQPNWTVGFSDFCNTIDPDDRQSAQILVYSTDITANIFYWLKVKVEEAWELEGSTLLDAFESEFIDN